MRIKHEGSDDGSYGNTPVPEDMIAPEHGGEVRGLTFWGHVDLAVRFLLLNAAAAYAVDFAIDAGVENMFPMNEKEISVVYWGFLMPTWVFITYRLYSSLTPEERRYLLGMNSERNS
jgi:hypothetical protein